LATENNNLSAIESAILQTITYVDVFDYPLTPTEVHRYLIGVETSAEGVNRILSSRHLVPGRLNRKDDYIFLSGRSAIVEHHVVNAGVFLSFPVPAVSRHHSCFVAGIILFRNQRSQLVR
jgi:hypothetical protein